MANNRWYGKPSGRQKTVNGRAVAPKIINPTVAGILFSRGYWTVIPVEGLEECAASYLLTLKSKPWAGPQIPL